MAITYERKKHKQLSVVQTIVTAILLCLVFLAVVGYLYQSAENDAFEQLHVQTKQIKDDIQLQLLSDRENLVTMANFASKLLADGENYDLMFESFKPIGLIENIGILNPDNTFVTKAGSLNLDGLISFEEEKAKGEYISGRVADLTRDDYEIIRSAVPIKNGGDIVGILYGVIKLDTIGERYSRMANEIDAQLFVYNKQDGELVIDTINDKLGNISFLKERKYNKDYSYEKMMESDKGYTSFVSAYTGEDLYLHYSLIEDIGWVITLARYESQVFAKTHTTSRVLLLAFLAMVVVMVLYTITLIASEKRRNYSMACASDIRRLLLDINQQHNNISEALKRVCSFANARSAIFFDTDGEDYNYFIPEFESSILIGEERTYFISEIFRYAAELYNVNKATVGVMCIKPNEHLLQTNRSFYDFLKKHNINEVSFATVTNKDNHVTVLGTVNPERSNSIRTLLEDVAVCFSIAIYNKKHLNKTEIAATTDSLTGVSNRVTYKKDLLMFDDIKPERFSCIYIDVNELHLRNNKYGHASGDEMLLYIANTLKEVFYGQHIYRMGGDEFLVFVRNTEQEAVKKNIQVFVEQLNVMDYHVAIGLSFRTQNFDTEEMVKEAEVRMYEAKAQYYQNKEQQSVSKSDNKGYIQIKTGIREIDTMISILKDHYNGIYRVSLETDKAHRILMPAYLGYNENEEHFSNLLKKYIEETVDADFHRAIMSFLNYDALKGQLMEGKIPKITYKKINGENVILSIYKLSDIEDSVVETLWVFSKD